MTVSAALADAFYRGVVESRAVWTLRDAGGFPTPHGDGGRSMPFWSSRSRVERIIANVPAYSSFEPFEISLDDFLARWLPGLERDGLKFGLNWSGERAVGYDVEPSRVAEAISPTRGSDV